MSWTRVERNTRVKTGQLATAPPAATDLPDLSDTEALPAHSKHMQTASDRKSDSLPKKPTLYSRADLLKLYHTGRAKGLPVELLGHELRDGEWDQAGLSDVRNRHRTTSSEHHMGLGSGRINGGLRGRGGTGLQGGVLSGLGGSLSHKPGRPDEFDRGQTRGAEDLTPEKWGPRKDNTAKSDVGAWRRHADIPDASNGPSAAVSHKFESPSAGKPAIPVLTSLHDEEANEEKLDIPQWATEDVAPPSQPLELSRKSLDFSHQLKPAEPAPRRIDPGPAACSNGSVGVDTAEQTGSLRQSLSHISALSLDDELYEDPLLNRRRGSSSIPLSRSVSAQQQFTAPGPPPGLTAPMPSQWRYRDTSGNIQGK